MGFMDLKLAAETYTKEPMKTNIKCLLDFDEFHCLLAGNEKIAAHIRKEYAGLPAEYMEWLSLCDGGILFDTVMLSSKQHDDDLDLDFDTYDELNSQESKSAYDLPEGYVIFAILSYGDPVCFSEDEKDEKIYLWDAENKEFSDIWNSFADWFTEEIDDAVQLIAEEVLDPMGIKLNVDDDE